MTDKIKIPGSKSFTNRALICASLAEGDSIIENAILCDDTLAMAKGLAKLGVNIEHLKEKFLVKGHYPENLHPVDREIYVGAAGTTMRFLTGFCSLIKGPHRLTGTQRMYQRPIDDLVNALNQIIDGDIIAESINKDIRRCPPVKIDTKGLKGGNVNIRVDLGSQYLSSLLMVSPYANKDVLITCIGEFIEKPYVDMTIATMNSFGVNVEKREDAYLVRVGQKYKPTTYLIESDASNATYFMAAAAITGRKLSIGEFKKDSKQGDLGFVNILEQMGCTVNWNGAYIEVEGPNELNGIDVDLGTMPDTVQTLAVLAAVANGKTTITGIPNLRIKETDRIHALEKELSKVGIQTKSTKDSLTIYGGNPKPAEIETYDDHRMAMSFSVLRLRIPEIIIKNPECVSKSFPNFYKLFNRL
ncbi:3-phosphoshikimate 1-carboxyvinyltransferase [Candidatus Woesearchaeota archaeon]|nr:3-phosphoshikimate 1-carboxyvinyltransferase [Candidatus Woesearchaeota archaeon]